MYHYQLTKLSLGGRNVLKNAIIQTPLIFAIFLIDTVNSQNKTTTLTGILEKYLNV